MTVIKQMNELFSEEGLTPKQYVDVARIKASRVQRNKDYPLTKAEKAVLNEIERDLTKWKERMAKFAPQTQLELLTKPKKVPAPALKQPPKTTKKTTTRRKTNVKTKK